MSHPIKSIIFSLAILLTTSTTFAQIWPLSPMLRFGNTVYYKLEDKQTISLHGTNLAWGDKEIGNRFFDVLPKTDSIQILLNGTTYYFGQKARKEPRPYKEILFYSRRKLRNDIATIKYLKLIEIKDSSIIARATLRYKHHLFRKREMIEIKREELEGVFIGAGKNDRIFMITVGYGAAVIALFFL